MSDVLNHLINYLSDDSSFNYSFVWWFQLLTIHLFTLYDISSMSDIFNYLIIQLFDIF